MRLRDYQADAKLRVNAAWGEGYKNILLIEPTGAGKTVIFSDILRDINTPRVAIAHRQELVTQISLALARDEVPHSIIGPKNVVKLANRIHMDELGKSYCVPSARCAVAGVDTLVRRKDDPEMKRWANGVTHWVQDEGHHVLEANKWGTAAAMFPNASGLGVSAACIRADGKGLGRDYHGVYDNLIVGPSGSELIERGFLTGYRIFAPPSDVDYSDVNISEATGDYNPRKLKIAVRRSRIVGDVVKSYLEFAAGKLGVTFASDVETATDIARQYSAAGVPAAVVSAKTPDAERAAVLRRFRDRELMQLVNVDLFGEGFDLPAIEVVSMTRKTMSLQLYRQQFGRALRVMVDQALYKNWDIYTDQQRRAHIAASGKPTAIIIDHVGNVAEHKLPDTPRHWSLAARTNRGSLSADVTPVATCHKCMSVFERFYSACPFCGHKNIPVDRSAPIHVDGDLIELDQAVLASMRADIERVNMTAADYRIELAGRRVPLIGQMGHVNRHVDRQAAQKSLRESIALWAGLQRHLKRDDSESYKRFYFKFGVDVYTAQALNTKAAAELQQKIDAELIGITRL